ncbi:MAG: hypothetical protein KKC68_00410 [Candidatus Thermoplasmatota archaeon]|nr:hypothetical protein [Candidatus Thermoplasmatota archaeon]MBU1940214.1 hypothetical protein [Candidatus Thermoplasmatota archaeon]
MKQKMVGMVICMLLIISTISATGTMVHDAPKQANDEIQVDSAHKTKVDPSYFWWLIGADQKQYTSCGYGFGLYEDYVLYAQSFQPSKKKLTAVAVGMFKRGSLPTGLMVKISIRDDLYGADLTSKTINADRLTGMGDLYLADFDDIQVVPDQTYYIVVRGYEGHYWLFDVDEKYDRGHPWDGFSYYGYSYWEPFTEYENFTDMDFMFITYFIKPISTPLSYLAHSPVIKALVEQSLLGSLLTVWQNR